MISMSYLPKISRRSQTWVVGLLLLILVVVGSFFRLWNFSNTLMFQGDQGRDALIVSQMFKAGDPVFIGPGTSVGSMYLGPFYYYFMLPFLWLSYPSPLGPALGVALVSLITIPLVYWLGKEVVGQRGAILAAFFFTLSASIVEYSRFSWNPNLAPTLSLLIVFFTYRAIKRHPAYWVAVALSFGLVIQLHYVALLTLGGIGLAWLSQVRYDWLKNKRQLLRHIFIFSIIGVSVFMLTLLPLVLFDFRHNFVNWQALQTLLTQDQAFSQDNRTGAEKMLNLSLNLVKQTQLVLSTHVITTQPLLSGIFLATLATGVWQLLKKANGQNHGVWLLVAFLIPSLVGLSFYQKEMHVHYFLFVLPIFFLLLGSVTASFSRHLVTLPLTIIFLVWYTIFNLQQMPLESLSWTIADVDRTTQVITSHLNPTDKVSLVLLGPSKDLYAQNYRYYLSTTQTPALPPEQAVEANTLVVINEERLATVATVPIYEIMIFPEKNQEEVYTIPNGPTIHIFRKSSP